MRRRWWWKFCDDEAQAEWRVFFIHEEKLALWIALSRNEWMKTLSLESWNSNTVITTNEHRSIWPTYFTLGTYLNRKLCSSSLLFTSQSPNPQNSSATHLSSPSEKKNRRIDKEQRVPIMQRCGFTFRADSGTPKFELSSQPAVPMTLEFDLGAIAGAPKGKRPINHPKSRVSRALALQSKCKTSFAATPLHVDLPAPEETINSKTRLSRFQENLDIRQQNTLAAETKIPIDVPLPASVSSRCGINEEDVLCLSQWASRRSWRWGLSGFGMWLLWRIVSKGRTSLGEESVAKVEHIFRRGYRRMLRGEMASKMRGRGGWERTSYFEWFWEKGSER